MVPSNPFSTFDGQNFPDFSPIFTKSRTPINTEVRRERDNLLLIKQLLISLSFRGIAVSDGQLITYQDW